MFVYSAPAGANLSSGAPSQPQGLLLTMPSLQERAGVNAINFCVLILSPLKLDVQILNHISHFRRQPWD